MAQVESRALTMFLSALHTESTRKQYLYWLDKYLGYSGKLNYEELIKDDPKIIQKSLEDYLLGLIDMHTRSYISVQFNALFLFFAMNDVILNTTKIIKMFPNQDLKVGGLAYSDQDVKKILDSAEPSERKSKKTLRNIALIHFLASSGCRLGAISGLKLKALEPIEDCYAVTIYAGSVYRYLTFLTPEARKSLDTFLRARKELLEFQGIKLTGDDLVFHMSDFSVARILNRIVNRSGVRLSIKKPRYEIPVIHGFRKRFNTVLKSNKDINPNLVELMMGHSTTIKLDAHYLKPTKERLFEEFKKGIADLTIFKKKEETANWIDQND